MKRKGKILLVLLIVAGGIFAFYGAFLGVEAVFRSSSSAIKETLAEYDIFCRWKNASWRYPLHFSWKEFSFSTKKRDDFPSFYADDLTLSFHPARIFRGVFLPVSLQLTGGKLLIPVFPENAGQKKMEKGDFLLLRDLHLDLKGIPGEIRVKNFSGTLGEGRFILSGTIDNLLHTVTASFFGSLREALLRDPHRKEKRDIKEIITSFFSFQLPLETRKDLKRYFLEFQKENGDLAILLRSEFHLDCNDYFRNRMEGSFSVSGFRWRKVEFLPVREKFTLAGGCFELPQLIFRTPSGNFLSFSGRYDGKKELLNGSFQGKFSPLLWKKFFPADLVGKLDKLPLSYGEEMVLSGKIFSWKIGEKKSLDGELALNFSHLKGPNGIHFKDGLLALQMKNGVLKGDFFCRNMGKLPSREKFLTFQLDEKGNTALSLFGETPLAPILAFPQVKALLPPKLVFAPHEKVTFTLEYCIPSQPGKLPHGTLSFSLPFFRYDQLPFQDIRGKVELKNDLLIFRYLRMRQENMGLEFAGEALLGEKALQGNIKLRGSPGKAVCQLLAQQGGAAGKYLFNNLVFPKKGELAEVNGHFFYRGQHGKTPPFWYWDGNLVMENFSWQKVPFTYFSGRILADSDFKGALQGATFQSRTGEPVLSLLYDPTKGKNGGSFQWELKSHLSGNEILKSLLPENSLGDFNFPDPIPLVLSGRTYLAESGKDIFRGTVNNGSFCWRELSLSKVDALMEYKNETLFIRNAAGVCANGRIQFGYSYDFSRDKGSLELALENGNLAQILKVLKADFQELDTSRGKVSGTLKTSISCPENSTLTLLEGKGKAVIQGDDLWKIPIFGEVLNILGKTWNTRNLGSITEVNADFSLSGTKFIADKIRSNGSVVGIQMNGYYDWEKEDLDFRIRSELLRGTLPFEAMSKVLSPVSWILEKRLRGKGVEHKWEWFVGDLPLKREK